MRYLPQCCSFNASERLRAFNSSTIKSENTFFFFFLFFTYFCRKDIFLHLIPLSEVSENVIILNYNSNLKHKNVDSYKALLADLCPNDLHCLNISIADFYKEFTKNFRYTITVIYSPFQVLSGSVPVKKDEWLYEVSYR